MKAPCNQNSNSWLVYRILLVISFQEDDVENNMQSFEYSHEMENSAKKLW